MVTSCSQGQAAGGCALGPKEQQRSPRGPPAYHMFRRACTWLGQCPGCHERVKGSPGILCMPDMAQQWQQPCSSTAGSEGSEKDIPRYVAQVSSIVVRLCKAGALPVGPRELCLIPCHSGVWASCLGSVCLKDIDRAIALSLDKRLLCASPELLRKRCPQAGITGGHSTHQQSLKSVHS